MLYVTVKALFVQNKFLKIFTVTSKFKLLLHSAYNNKNYDSYHMNSYTKIFILSSHLNLIPKILKLNFEKKKAFPLLVKHSIKNDILLNNTELKINNEFMQEERKEDNLFPSKIIGNVEKKGRLLGLNNPRYLELDCIKGLIKRYKSTDDYPEKPK